MMNIYLTGCSFPIVSNLVPDGSGFSADYQSDFARQFVEYDRIDQLLGMMVGYYGRPKK